MEFSIHPSCSSEFASSDFYVFGVLKEFVGDQSELFIGLCLDPICSLFNEAVSSCDEIVSDDLMVEE